MDQLKRVLGTVSMASAMVAGLAAFAPNAGAVVLAPGATAATPGTTAATRPELAGVVLEDVIRNFTIINAATGALVAKGTLQDRVVKETVSGTLDFYYRITNDAASPGNIGVVRRKAFAGFDTDVDWRIDGLGDLGTKSASRTVDGISVTFIQDANSLITPGSQTRFVFIKTNATTYNAFGSTSIAAFTPGAAGGSATFATFQPAGAGSGASYHIYKIMQPDITRDDANRVAGGQGFTPIGKGPNAPSVSEISLFGDGSANVRMVFNSRLGTMESFPLLVPAVTPPPPVDECRKAGGDFLEANHLLPAVQDGLIGDGEVITTAGLPSSGRIAGNISCNSCGTSNDVMRTVHFTRMLDGLPVVGPMSQLSVDVNGDGIAGFDRTMRPLQKTGFHVVMKSREEANSEFNTQLHNYLIGLLRGDPGVTYQLLSTDFLYFEQGKQYVQPVYRFNVEFTGANGEKSGESFVIPASRYTPEAIVNNQIDTNNPIYAGKIGGVGGVPQVTGNAQPNVPAVQYGIYVVRQDNRFIQDAWGFHTNLELVNPLAVLFGYPHVNFNQYYWDYQWMWEPDPADGIPDNSPAFVGANHVVLFEGHGAPWTVSTRSSCCDIIDYPTIPGYGGFNGHNGKTAYIVWHTCDSIPAPGDPYAYDYQAPSGPFDVWFSIFKGMRGNYGARTTVDIYNGAGPAFATLTGLGVPNLSAWLHVEANALTGHHDNWDMGTAVLISGHENDKIYDVAPLAPPGSLTMYWQHP